MFSEIREKLDILFRYSKCWILNKFGLLIVPQKLPETIVCEISKVRTDMHEAKIISPKGYENHTVCIHAIGKFSPDYLGVCRTGIRQRVESDESTNNHPQCLLKTEKNLANAYTDAWITLGMEIEEIEKFDTCLKNIDQYYTAIFGKDSSLPEILRIELKLKDAINDCEILGRVQKIVSHKLIPLYRNDRIPGIFEVN